MFSEVSDLANIRHFGHFTENLDIPDPAKKVSDPAKKRGKGGKRKGREGEEEEGEGGRKGIRVIIIFSFLILI